MNVEKQPFVSVVTPVYNGAPFIGECIESVLAQTYSNWDYTIVNNCSTDHTLAIAQKYAANDSRIRVLDNTQFLQSLQNHNHALRQISPASKYCKVVFGDDWILPECLERMIAIAEAHPSVGIVGAYGLQDRTVMFTGLPYTRTVVTGRELFVQQFLGKGDKHRQRLYLFGCASSLLFRADLVRHRDPFFDESDLHADASTCWALLRDVDFGFAHQVLTANRLAGPNSNSTFSERMNTFVAGALRQVVMHGEHFLSRKEFHFARERLLREYYEFLATSAIHGRQDEQFWNFHKRSLNEIGGGFSKARLTKEIARKLVNVVLNPKLTIEKHLLRSNDTLIAHAITSDDPDRSPISPPQPESEIVNT